MLLTENERLRQNIMEWVDEVNYDRSGLIPILQKVQKKYHRVSSYAMQVIADALDIHPVEVYSVVSFYSFLDEKSKGRFIIRLCQTISCDMAGKSRVARQLENELGIQFGQTTADGKFTLEYTNCLGMCDRGPAMLVNDQVFTHVTPEKAHEIIEKCRQTFGVFALQDQERIG
ncbi:NADH-quinone oxidoreductase subunit NuoE [bacterium]|nr:NADH-quinone oxidoreductase subunit NuoE [candidate division CSSED10-310 bacterium]